MLPIQISKVHVFSFVPRMVEEMRQKFPKLTICPVLYEENYNHFLKKVVTEKELIELKEADVLITDSHLLVQVYQKLPKLVWAQLSYAGIEAFARVVKENSTPPRFSVTRCISFHQQVVEYIVAWIINNQRGFHKLLGLQRQKIWKRNMALLPNYHPTLKDLTIGIVGVGEIGRSLAGILKLFNSNVLGYARSSTPSKDVQLDSYWHGDQLPQFLAECDYIINLLPSTPETKDFFGGDTLRSARKKPTFMNVGRGDVISNEDVIKALDNGWISKAILDVFTEEPLPSSCPLWKHPNVIITPHFGGIMTAVDVAESFKVNMENLSKNEPLKNLVDWQKGY